MSDITICVMSCGELTLKDCLQSLKQFKDEVIFQEVTNVFPQIKALNQMVEQAQTEYLIPIDADMLLTPDAWSRIREAVNKYKFNLQWHSILFPLWDTLTERKILALKILRTQIVKKHPFVDGPTPDVKHYQDLTRAGFTCIHDYLNECPIGNHVVKGKHFCYNKYRDVYQTYRSYKFEWDSGAFMGGDDLRERAKAHFDFFLHKWIITDNEDYMHCIAGMIDGILSPFENKSKTLEKQKYRIPTKYAFHHFMNWYLKPMWQSGNLLF